MICRENFLEIDVFMKELYYEQVEQNVAYDLTNLWSKCNAFFWSGDVFLPKRTRAVLTLEVWNSSWSTMVLGEHCDCIS